MLFQYLGTAAAEGVPGLFCDCPVCTAARKKGGRCVRSRSQAVIDGKLLIDFPADTFLHVVNAGLDLTKIRACLITHTHMDHLYAKDIFCLRGGYSSRRPEGYHLTFYGSKTVTGCVAEEVDPFAGEGSCDYKTVTAFETFDAAGYTVTAFKAIHDPNSDPLFYAVSDGKKTVLYAHDTHYFCDEVWEYLEKNKPHFDLVSLDCTNCTTPVNYIGHMGLPENIKVKERLLRIGCADEKTVFVCNHFSHNGGNADYDDFVQYAAKEGFLVSYDGMKMEI